MLVPAQQPVIKVKSFISSNVYIGGLFDSRCLFLRYMSLQAIHTLPRWTSSCRCQSNLVQILRFVSSTIHWKATFSGTIHKNARLPFTEDSHVVDSTRGPLLYMYQQMQIPASLDGPLWNVREFRRALTLPNDVGQHKRFRKHLVFVVPPFEVPLAHVRPTARPTVGMIPPRRNSDANT